MCHSSGCCFTEFLPNYVEHTEVLMKTVKLANQGSLTGTVYMHLQLVINLISDSKFKGSVAEFFAYRQQAVTNVLSDSRNVRSLFINIQKLKIIET